MIYRAGATLLVVMSATIAQPADEAVSRETLRQWGFDALARIVADLQGPYSPHYADEARLDGYRAGPAFNWGVGVMITALTAATHHEPLTAARLEAYGNAVEVYWNPEGPVSGYDVLPVPKPVDRYYDDNQWLVLGFLEAYELTANPAWLDRARRALVYSLSGEDETLGGGIWWRESPRDGKNTCSNAPAVVACYRFAEVTGETEWLARGNTILDWTLANLQDPADGLMWDGMNANGEVNERKWTYNTALTLRALADVSRDAASLQRAVEMGRAALAHWQDPETGALKDDAQFAHLLTDALLYVDSRTGTGEFRPAVLRALTYLHDHGRDELGHYSGRWEAQADGRWSRWQLIHMASAVRGYLQAAK